MPDYELIYFPFRGRCEMTRYLLHLAGQNFKDTTVPVSDWPAKKKEMPFGQMPVLKIDGNPLSQSTAIARYIANEFDLNGETNLEKAMCDQYVDALHVDMYSKFLPVGMIIFNGGSKEAALAEFQNFKNTYLKALLDRFERCLEANGTGHLVGKKLTWADVAVAEFMERFLTKWDEHILDPYPNLARLTDEVHKLPPIKKYAATRPNYPL